MRRYVFINQQSSESLKKIIEEGRHITIEALILSNLAIRPMAAFELLKVINCLRSSLCQPLRRLVLLDKIEIIGTKYDYTTRRNVSLYALKGTSLTQSPGTRYPLQAKLFQDEPYQ